jgi:hypothetical protein
VAAANRVSFKPCYGGNLHTKYLAISLIEPSFVANQIHTGSVIHNNTERIETAAS